MASAFGMAIGLAAMGRGGYIGAVSGQAALFPETFGRWPGAGWRLAVSIVERDLSDLANLTDMIEPVVVARGFQLVRVAWIGGGGGSAPTLQVMVEDPATGQMTVDDCASVSRVLSAMLDEADPIDEEYVLEVSSPGIDRPLTRLADYDRWAGHLAKLELAEGIATDGALRKRFEGELLGSDGDAVRIAVDGLGEVALPFAGIASAKLMLTDKLIAASVPLSTDGVDEIEEEADEADPAAGWN
jgi:ribosome maturation factor RimP